MLPAEHRLRSSQDFTAVTRGGAKARCGALVVYLLPNFSADDSAAPVAARFGLVVGKSVGGSVVRHQVSRRLRAQLSRRTGSVAAGARVVVRALPQAAAQPSELIGRDLDRAFGKLSGAGRSSGVLR
ncbi:MAG TPA: ribonuclease P protein component [Jatrophihabitans sp.]|jgi:ribonuclease P protein component